jgi:ABC-type branched-subunit amino acid transport system substrate-binding protein
VTGGAGKRVRATRALGVALLGVSLVAAACGGGDDSSSASSATVDSAVQSGIANQLGGSSTTAPPAEARPASMEAWEALWADQRAAAVKRIKDNKWGISADGATLTGPEGFHIDLSKCPAGWSNTEGLTDTSIKIGQTIAQSGAYAAYGAMARGIEVNFGYYNDKGGFTDSTGKTRKIEYIAKDDGFDPARTIPLVDELIDSERVFAVFGLGAAGALKSYDKLNERCIPEPAEMNGHPAMGDPVNHPWTTGMQLTATTEAVIWGTFIEKHLDEFPGQVKVAAIRTNDDNGASYESGFKGFLAQSAHKDRITYQSETIEGLSRSVMDPMATLAATKPDVFIGMVAGAACTQTILEAAQDGLKEQAKYLLLPLGCKNTPFVNKAAVGGDGMASDGWRVSGGGYVDFNATANDNDAYISWAREQLAKNGIDYKLSSLYGSGFNTSWVIMQAVQIADALPGGLNRANFILALRTMDMTQPTLLTGVKFNMNGNADAYPTEGSDISRWDASQQAWVVEDIIDVSGKTKPCAWDSSQSVCR